MQEILNEKHQTFYEILTNADRAEDPVKYIQTCMNKDSRILPILGYAFNPRFKIPLPEGNPPYIPSQHPIGVAPLEILNLSNKLYVMFNKDAKQFRKEAMIAQWLEDMAPEEAELMVHIKDQTLDTVYKNLTLTVFLKALGWSPETLENARNALKALESRP